MPRLNRLSLPQLDGRASSAAFGAGRSVESFGGGAGPEAYGAGRMSPNYSGENGWARDLEAREVARSGFDRRAAQEAVARRTGVPASKLISLAKNRLKSIGVGAFEALRAGMIRELEQEMRRLEHELQLLRATGMDPRQDEMAEVVADLAKARQALGLPAIDRRR